MRTMPDTTFHARWLLGPGLALGILAAASASAQDCFDETDLQLLNGGQQATRQEAVWLYTAANGWFSREEDDPGSIEIGKFGDFVVLNNDFFDEEEVADEDIRNIASVLTTAGGRVVHYTGVLN